MRPVTLALGWMLVVLALLSIPGQELPRVEFRWADKVAHAACFFVFGLLWMRAMRGTYLRRALLTLAFGVCYGFGTELYQALMPLGRLFDPFDAVADVAGTLLAILVCHPVFRKKATPLSNRERFTVS